MALKILKFIGFSLIGIVGMWLGIMFCYFSIDGLFNYLGYVFSIPFYSIGIASLLILIANNKTKKIAIILYIISFISIVGILGYLIFKANI